MQKNSIQILFITYILASLTLGCIKEDIAKPEISCIEKTKGPYKAGDFISFEIEVSTPNVELSSIKLSVLPVAGEGTNVVAIEPANTLISGSRNFKTNIKKAKVMYNYKLLSVPPEYTRLKMTFTVTDDVEFNSQEFVLQTIPAWKITSGVQAEKTISIVTNKNFISSNGAMYSFNEVSSNIEKIDFVVLRSQNITKSSNFCILSPNQTQITDLYKVNQFNYETKTANSTIFIKSSIQDWGSVNETVIRQHAQIIASQGLPKLLNVNTGEVFIFKTQKGVFGAFKIGNQTISDTDDTSTLELEGQIIVP